jgi:hypothetical protein
MQRELVPVDLREPLLLSNPHNNMSIATARASEIVAARKGKSEAVLNKWAGANKPFKTCKRSFVHGSIYCAAKPKH